MKIIKDEEKQLNLNPFVIYFVLSSKNYTDMADSVSQLNKNNHLTQGIFKFQPVKRTGNYSSAVSSGLIASIKNYNMIVRLMDDNSGCFHYAVQKITFVQSRSDLENAIYKFIAGVCNQNVEQLNSYIKNCSTECKLSKEKGATILEMQNMFRNALEVFTFRLNNQNEDIYGSQKNSDSNYINIPKDIPEWVKQAVVEEDMEKFTSWIKSLEISDEETSDSIASGCYNEDNDNTLRRDKYKRKKNNVRPKISVEVKLPSRKNSCKKGYVIFTIDGETYEIHFGSKEAIMIYVITLFRIYMGSRLYRHEFYNNSKGLSKKSYIKRCDKTTKWLNDAYNLIFTDDKFENEIEKIELKKGSPLDQGKSESSRNLKDAIKSEDALYYLLLDTKEDELKDSFFIIEVLPDEIIFPNDNAQLTSLLNNSNFRIIE